MLRVALVPSHAFHVSLGMDFRIVNQIYPLVNLDVELHYMSPFSKPPLPSHDHFHFHSLTNYPFIYDQGYKFTRYAFNSPLFARHALRSLNYLELSTSQYARKLEKSLKPLNVDVILAIHQSAAAACAKIRNKLGIPVVADIHGPWSEEIVDSGILERSSVAASNVRKFESEMLRRMDLLIVVTDELKSYFVTQYLIEPKRVIPINPCARPKVEDAKRVSKPSRIVCAGAAAHRQGLDLLIRTMSLVLQEYPSAELYITRKGLPHVIKSIRHLAEQMKVSPRYFYFPSPSAFDNFLKDCHIGVITSTNDINRRICFPGKLYNYLSVGLPIVANDIGGWTRFIRESGCGILTNSTPSGLADGILELLRNPELIYEMGRKGLNYLRSVLKPEKLIKDFRDVLILASQTA